MQQLDEPQLWNTWLEHVEPAKKHRAVEAHKHALLCPIDVNTPKLKSVLVNVKKDEVLLKLRRTEADKGFVPRPIHNVDPIVAVELGPHVYAATEKLKCYWRWDAPNQARGEIRSEMTGMPIYITFGAGLSTQDLDAWFAFAIANDGWHLLVAGDDSVAIGTHNGRIIVVEGDISKCDHSVRADALRFQYAVLSALGVPRARIEQLSVNSSATCVVAGRRIDGGSLKLQRGVERNTGGVDTTVGNTIVVMGPLAYAAASMPVEWNLPTPQHEVVQTWFETAFANCGLDLKARVTIGTRALLGTTFWPPSFLKGTWWPTPTGWHWGPLLSRLLKISKIMVDPRVVYKTPDFESASRRHMSAVFLSMSTFVWPEEIKVWLQARSDPAWTETKPLEEWDHDARPRGAPGPQPIVDPRWYDQAAAWYGVSADEIQAFVRHLTDLDVGQFSFHPMWVTMALRDYN